MMIEKTEPQRVSHRKNGFSRKENFPIEFFHFVCIFDMGAGTSENGFFGILAILKKIISYTYTYKFVRFTSTAYKPQTTRTTTTTLLLLLITLLTTVWPTTSFI
jgi:hypothetical protein